MAQNFIECDREQAFLMPPSLREWLPEDHLAWFVLEAVEEMDLSEFYADYRSDGHGRAAYEPSMMVALLLYAYATAQRSSRGIEIHCRQDIGYRVVAANRVPDHATIARFLARHEAALADLFGSVLALCARAGLVSTGVVAIDGTKLKANASREANLDYGRIAREIVAEAKATDGAEDELYGEARGDELPAELRTREGRRRWLSEAKRRRSMPSRPIRRRPQLSPPSPPTSLPQSRAAGRSTRVAAGGTATPASASTSAVSARRARSRARARNGLRRQGAGSRRSLRPSAARTRPMRATGRAGSAATGAASAANRRAPTRSLRRRPGRSTRPTPTRACSR
jgi:transposase